MPPIRTTINRISKSIIKNRGTSRGILGRKIIFKLLGSINTLM
uniref:Uncharacterized protein n=1 Tax=Meloidogyne enterolobii TaxID=390850 RepID=A0A6V7Y252_MELEN|nr:unnamed protein product [Meloidogyne enterolobii]